MEISNNLNINPALPNPKSIHKQLKNIEKLEGISDAY